MDDVLRGFAAYRLARLVVEDDIFETPRARLHAWLMDHNRWLLNLVSCGYCVSVWISAALTLRRPSLVRLMAVSGVAAVAWSVDRVAVAEPA